MQVGPKPFRLLYYDGIYKNATLLKAFDAVIFPPYTRLSDCYENIPKLAHICDSDIDSCLSVARSFCGFVLDGIDSRCSNRCH